MKNLILFVFVVFVVGVLFSSCDFLLKKRSLSFSNNSNSDKVKSEKLDEPSSKMKQQPVKVESNEMASKGIYHSSILSYVIKMPNNILLAPKLPKTTLDSLEIEYYGGEVFKDKNGAEFLAISKTDLLLDNINKIFKNKINQIRNKLGSEKMLAYKILKPDYFVVTWTDGSEVHYLKGILQKRCIYKLEFKYSISSKDLYDPIVVDMCNSFKIVQ